ncbi:MAG: hypothetical protein ABSE77_14315 [Acidimicrobiales bacterium]|jgi:hypothetical protein
MAGSTVIDEVSGTVVVVVGRGGVPVVAGVVVESRADALLTAAQPVKLNKTATRAAKADFRLRTAPTVLGFSSPSPPIVIRAALSSLPSARSVVTSARSVVTSARSVVTSARPS